MFKALCLVLINTRTKKIKTNNIKKGKMYDYKTISEEEWSQWRSVGERPFIPAEWINDFVAVPDFNFVF